MGEFDPSVILLQQTHCHFNLIPIPSKNLLFYSINSADNIYAKQAIAGHDRIILRLKPDQPPEMGKTCRKLSFHL